MSLDRRAFVTALLGSAALSACGGGSSLPRPGDWRRGGGSTPEGYSPGFTDIDFADWSEAEPEYLLYPGDQIDVRTPSAPELNQSLTVGPDGRVAMPLVGQVMAADRTLYELESELVAAYTPILRRPRRPAPRGQDRLSLVAFSSRVITPSRRAVDL